MEQEPFAKALQLREDELHGDKWRLELDDSIEKGGGGGWFQYIRKSFAEFRCSTCKRYWPSKRVMVLFHFRLNERNRLGVVKVRRFRQQCRKCNRAKMEVPRFSLDNIDVMVEKLIERIRMRCYGENLGESYRPLHFHGRVNGPHESSHCEACQKGICQQGT